MPVEQLRRARIAVTSRWPEWLKRPVRPVVYGPLFGLRWLTAPWRALPDFLILGAKRAGSTSLWNLVACHPLVGRAWRKEVGYFGRRANRSLRWYRAHFPMQATQTVRGKLRGHQALTGEADPDYLFHPAVPQAAHDLVPDAKLIALLRNPVDRAISDYHLEVRLGLETLSLKDAVQKEPERLGAELEKVLSNRTYYSPGFYDLSYLARGIYIDQIRAWLEYYGRAQLLILKAEDFFDKPERAHQRVLDFLGLPSHRPPVYPAFNKAQYSEAGEDIRAQLQEYFEPHNRRLYEFLGEDWDWHA